MESSSRPFDRAKYRHHIKSQNMNTRHLKKTEWRLVFSRIRDDILSQRLQPGASLPTIKELSRVEGISFHAARSVLKKLCERQLAESWQGRGFRVKSPNIDVTLGQTPWFSKYAKRSGIETTATLISKARLMAPTDISRSMKLAARETVLRTNLLRSANGVPTSYTQNYFPQRFEGIFDLIEQTGSVTASLHALGVTKILRTKTTIKARPPTATERVILNIPPNNWMLITAGINTDEEGNIVEYSIGSTRADSISFTFEN